MIGKILGRRATVIDVFGIMICTLSLLVAWIYDQAVLDGRPGSWRIGVPEGEGRLMGVFSSVMLLGLVG